ncbi:unnamed protein product [Didymodactylos carnosus]|uniref:PiggyBac transposable element-derived protein domain-containing protein n=1 Tax=Didymodactylos carnosus TaxID=1234261 RepID=A0A815Q9D0_9BILA|nr:unnamed protein product [Didymodactylos carnosus]CAF4330594.1 unnamed protein product [Didymodactylos carnosus]
MATCTTNDPHEIQMDRESEGDSTMEIDAVYSSDVDSSESDDEIGSSKQQSTDRIWKKTAFKPHLFSFDETNAGLSSNIDAMKDATPLEFFQLLFNETIIDLIVEETNKYQAFSNNDATSSASSHQAKWTETNRSEIYTFLATIMLMSVIKKNKILNYWSTDPMIITPMFGGRPITSDNPVRLTGRHFPSLVPATATQESPQRDCIVCSRTSRHEKKRTKTRYQCDICDVGLV